MAKFCFAFLFLLRCGPRSLPWQITASGPMVANSTCWNMCLGHGMNRYLFQAPDLGWKAININKQVDDENERNFETLLVGAIVQLFFCFDDFNAIVQLCFQRSRGSLKFKVPSRSCYTGSPLKVWTTTWVPFKFRELHFSFPCRSCDEVNPHVTYGAASILIILCSNLVTKSMFAACAHVHNSDRHVRSFFLCVLRTPKKI